MKLTLNWSNLDGRFWKTFLNYMMAYVIDILKEVVKDVRYKNCPCACC